MALEDELSLLILTFKELKQNMTTETPRTRVTYFTREGTTKSSTFKGINEQEKENKTKSTSTMFSIA